MCVCVSIELCPISQNMNLIINVYIMYMNEYMDRWLIIVNLHQIDHIFEHHCIISSGNVVTVLQM